MADILDLGALETARAIAEGRISTFEAVNARIDRIERVNPRLNGVVVKLYDEALAQAREVDAMRTSG
jgi:Asp-tRNA(Asn)/Glu-tRNA(Gln) amidotransferase A subunit family amidase